MDLETRSRRLEQSARRWKIGCSAASACAALAAAGHLSARPAVAQQDGAPAGQSKYGTVVVAETDDMEREFNVAGRKGWDLIDVHVVGKVRVGVFKIRR